MGYILKTEPDNRSLGKVLANTLCKNNCGLHLEIIILSELSHLDRERQISYDITYMWNLKKMIQMNLFTKQK